MIPRNIEEKKELKNFFLLKKNFSKIHFTQVIFIHSRPLRKDFLTKKILTI